MQASSGLPLGKVGTRTSDLGSDRLMCLLILAYLGKAVMWIGCRYYEARLLCRKHLRYNAHRLIPRLPVCHRRNGLSLYRIHPWVFEFASMTCQGIWKGKSPPIIPAEHGKHAGRTEAIGRWSRSNDIYSSNKAVRPHLQSFLPSNVQRCLQTSQPTSSSTSTA